MGGRRLSIVQVQVVTGLRENKLGDRFLGRVG